MELKDDEFRSLQLRVDQISSELDKQRAIGAVNTKWMLIAAAVILAALGYTSIFQLPNEAAKAAMEKIGPEVIEKAGNTMEALRQYDNEAKDILGRLRDNKATTIQPDTLAFFNRDNCPEGWEEFEEGSRRFLIAAGNDYPFGTSGGKEKVALAVDEMPKHKHDATTKVSGKGFKQKANTWRGGGSASGSYTGFESSIESEVAIDSKGNSKPHENMPPFLALTLCRKQ